MPFRWKALLWPICCVSIAVLTGPVLTNGDESQAAAASSDKTEDLRNAKAPGELRADVRSLPAVSVVSPLDARTPGEDEYRFGAGDALQISVWKEPEVSVPSTVVRPDGNVTIPLLKDIKVIGRTPKEVEAMITAGLSSYISGVNVTVVVTGMSSKKIYIIGAVKREGPIAYTYKMTAMQALIEAGGLTDYAKRKKIYVLRARNGVETKIPFKYDDVLKGNNPDELTLMPNDTLVVPH
jgi:polysaccharide biosynthesis/export protein